MPTSINFERLVCVSWAQNALVGAALAPVDVPGVQSAWRSILDLSLSQRLVDILVIGCHPSGTPNL
jgi:hypothetical protein